MLNSLDEHEDHALAYLQAYTPFERWKTPEQIGLVYNYSAKHVLRLVKDEANHIVALEINGRWFIWQCSFENYLHKNS